MGVVNSTGTPSTEMEATPRAIEPTADADAANMTSIATGLNLPTLQLFMVFIYSVMSLAIFFNLRVIYMVLRALRLSRRSSAKSSSRYGPGSNQHAFVYVVSLSIVDSFVLAHMPFVATDILAGWVFGTAMCKLFWTIEQVNRILSTFILMALSGDRYLAVCYPLRFRQFRTTKAAVRVIAISVLVAAISLTPTYIYGRVIIYQGPHNRTIQKCTFDLDTVTADRFLIYIFVCGYCIPFFFMVFFYCSILRTLWKKNASAAALEATAAGVASRAQRNQKRARHVTQRALVLVLFYFGCWTPYWLIQIWLEFFFDPEAPRTMSQDTIFVVVYVVHVLIYFNSAVNPFLYALLNKELQQQSSSATSVHAGLPQGQSSARQRGLCSDEKPLTSGSHFGVDRSPLLYRKRGSVEQDPNEMPLLTQSAPVRCYRSTNESDDSWHS